MYDRGIEPIYGKKGALIRILELNNLTEAQARKLPKDFPIKLPNFEKLGMVKHPPMPEADPDPLVSEDAPEVVEKTPAITKQSSKLGASLGYYYYEGDGDRDAFSSFRAYGLGIILDYAYQKSWDEWSLLINPNFNIYSVQKLKKDYLTNYGLTVSGRKNFNKTFVGLGATYRSLFYIYGKEDKASSLNAIVPGSFIEIGHSFEALDVSIKGGANFSSEAKGYDIGTSPFATLILSKEIGENLSIKLDAHFEKRDFNQADQKFMSTSLGLQKSFH